VGKNIPLVERVGLAHLGFGFVNLTKPLLSFLEKKRAIERCFATFPAPEALASATFEAILDGLLSEKHEVTPF